MIAALRIVKKQEKKWCIHKKQRSYMFSSCIFFWWRESFSQIFAHISVMTTVTHLSLVLCWDGVLCSEYSTRFCLSQTGDCLLRCWMFLVFPAGRSCPYALLAAMMIIQTKIAPKFWKLALRFLCCAPYGYFTHIISTLWLLFIAEKRQLQYLLCWVAWTLSMSFTWGFSEAPSLWCIQLDESFRKEMGIHEQYFADSQASLWWLS